MDPSEIQFQPGTFLVRASALKPLLAGRTAVSDLTETDGSVPYPPLDGHPTDADAEVRDERSDESMQSRRGPAPPSLK